MAARSPSRRPGGRGKALSTGKRGTSTRRSGSYGSGIWIAAHIRERRYELELTQKEVAERAGTSHSFISKVEGGDHMPTIVVLKRILAVLDEELLIGIERRGDDAELERELALVPDIAV